MGGLRFDEVLQELFRDKVLVFALETGCNALDGDADDVGDVGWAEGVDAVLVEPVVQPGHLAAKSEVVERLIGDGERASRFLLSERKEVLARG